MRNTAVKKTARHSTTAVIGVFGFSTLFEWANTGCLHDNCRRHRSSAMNMAKTGRNEGVLGPRREREQKKSPAGEAGAEMSSRLDSRARYLSLSYSHARAS